MVLSAGSIVGSVFHDLNGDGAQDVGESGIAGATVFLDTNRNGALDGGEASTTTADGTGAAALGSYEFAGFAPGNYTVAQLLPTGWLQTAAGSPGVGRMGEAIHSFAAAGTDGPRGLAWVNGELYQVERDTAGTSSTIWRLDPTTGAVLGSFVPGVVVTDIEFDGTALWATNIANDTIVRMDLNGNVLHTFASPADNVTGIAWDGSHLWAVDQPQGATPPPAQAYKLDVSDLGGMTLPVVQTFATPSQANTGLTFDGQHLWIAARIPGGGTQSLFYQVDPATGQAVQSFIPPMTSQLNLSNGTTTYGSPSDLTFDGHTLWYADGGTAAMPPRIVQIDPGGDHRDVTVLDGQASAAAAIGNFQAAAISGTVFEDANADGDQDAGEQGLAGRTVFLDYNANGQLDTPENAVLTDAAGNYQLVGRIGSSSAALGGRTRSARSCRTVGCRSAPRRPTR